MDVVVLEEVDEVDHPCEAVGVEHEVDVVDSVIVAVDEEVDGEDSFLEVHQGVVVEVLVEEAVSEVDEVDTRLGYTCTISLEDLELLTTAELTDPFWTALTPQASSICRCSIAAGPPRSGQDRHASECNPPSFSTRLISTPASLAAEASSMIGE